MYFMYDAEPPGVMDDAMRVCRLATRTRERALYSCALRAWSMPTRLPPLVTRESRELFLCSS